MTTGGHFEKDQHYHDVIAREYDAVVVAPRVVTNDALYEQFKELIRGGRMLDLGCGTGHMSLRFGREFKEVVAVDHSTGMLEMARNKAAEAGLTHVQFICQSVFDYIKEAPEEYFDVVCCTGFLHHLKPEDIGPSLKKFAWVLRQGGLLVASEPIRVDPNSVPQEIRTWNLASVAMKLDYSKHAEQPDEAPIEQSVLVRGCMTAGLEIVKTARNWEIFPHNLPPNPQDRRTIQELNGRYGHSGNVFTFVAGKGKAGRMSSEQAGFNPLEYAQSFEWPAHVNAVAWHEHIPFAKALVQMLQPKKFVELGVHTGDSYLAICETIAALDLNAACYGVDTWKGDEHAGFYGEEILAKLRKVHDSAYGKFSRLVQNTFDEAAKEFSDGSIDLLHIDGLHTYDAVKHDWETWLPKMSARGVVLFHDTNVRERNFGVWMLWEELRSLYKSFEFLHGHGLGILRVGEQTPEAFNAFIASASAQPERVRDCYFALGNRITIRAQGEHDKAEFSKLVHSQIDEIKKLNAKILEYDTALRIRMKQAEELQKSLSEHDASLRTRVQQLGVAENKVAELDASLRTYAERIAALEKALTESREQYARTVGGTSFKIGRAVTAPLRILTGRGK